MVVDLCEWEGCCFFVFIGVLLYTLYCCFISKFFEIRD